MVTITTNLNSNYAILYYLATHLWAGAKDRWIDATDNQRQQVADRIEAYFAIASDVEINDFVWFNCDDIFFPEDNEPIEMELIEGD